MTMLLGAATLVNERDPLQDSLELQKSYGQSLVGLQSIELKYKLRN